jgi:hypothetical protein
MHKEIQKLLFKKQESKSNSYEQGNLHLRNLGLQQKDIIDLIHYIDQQNIGTNIQSISFSYNPLIGDNGVIYLLKKLPLSITEIGLVNCGISDKGGVQILNWMIKSNNLRLICMEQNDFSDKLKKEFNVFKKEHPNVIVVF